MSDLQMREALEYLKSPHLIDRILTDAKSTGHIGEESNFLLGYLVSVSRKLKQPLGLLVIAQSSSGKSALQDRVVSFMPPEDVVKLTRLTDQSLFYQERGALKNKLLMIEEEEGAQGAGYSIRHLLNANGLVSLTTVRDEATGRNKSVSHEVEGPTAIMLTTTHSEINYETYNRFVIMTIDESREQTRSILELQRKRETLEGLLERHQSAKVCKLHHNVQRLLKQYEIVNPFARDLSFTDSYLRARREQVKYLTLIKSVALLRQYQKEVKASGSDDEKFDYIEVDREDIKIANRLAQGIFASSLDDATPQTQKFLKLLDDMITPLEEKHQKPRLDIVVSRREIREHTGWSDYQIRKHLEELSQLEYVIPVQGSKGKRFTYVLAWERKTAQKREVTLSAP